MLLVEWIGTASQCSQADGEAKVLVCSREAVDS